MSRPDHLLETVQADRSLRCAASPHPGLAFPTADGQWHGLLVDICRAVSAAVLGEDGRFTIRPLNRQADWDAARAQGDALVFATSAEMVQGGLLGTNLPGPPVYYRTQQVMLDGADTARSLDQLSGQGICVEPGTEAERTLVSYFAAHDLKLAEFPFQEFDEMIDAYMAHRCRAIAGDTQVLAAMRSDARRAGRSFRILPEVLSATPVLATTPETDGRWAALVSWTVQTLMRAETDPRVAAGNLQALPIPGAPFGLDDHWQERVLAAVGSYGNIYARSLGADTPLDLPRGLNATRIAGGLLSPPLSE